MGRNPGHIHGCAGVVAAGNEMALLFVAALVLPIAAVVWLAAFDRKWKRAAMHAHEAPLLNRVVVLLACAAGFAFVWYWR